MTNIPKEKVAKIIDQLIDSSVKLHHIEITAKGLQNSIDELSTKLYFYYSEDDEQ